MARYKKNKLFYFRKIFHYTNRLKCFQSNASQCIVVLSVNLIFALLLTKKRLVRYIINSSVPNKVSWGTPYETFWSTLMIFCILAFYVPFVKNDFIKLYIIYSNVFSKWQWSSMLNTLAQSKNMLIGTFFLSIKQYFIS